MYQAIQQFVEAGLFGMLRLDPETVPILLTTTRIPGRFYQTGTEAARLLGPVVQWLVRASEDPWAVTGTITNPTPLFQSYKD